MNEIAGTSHEQLHKHGASGHSADTRAGWYILRCGAGLEFPAENALRNTGWDVFIPREKKWRPSLLRRQPVEIEYPRFPGYLFVEVAPPNWPRWDAWPLVRSIRGVLGMGGRPVPLASGEIDRLRADDGTVVPHAASVPMHKALVEGQMVRILDGPFRDFVVAIDGISERGAAAAVPIFGKRAEITLPLQWLEIA